MSSSACVVGHWTSLTFAVDLHRRLWRVSVVGVFQSLEAVAHSHLGRTVYVGWPHLYEVKVTAVSDTSQRSGSPHSKRWRNSETLSWISDDQKIAVFSNLPVIILSSYIVECLVEVKARSSPVWLAEKLCNFESFLSY